MSFMVLCAFLFVYNQLPDNAYMSITICHVRYKMKPVNNKPFSETSQAISVTRISI